LQLHAEATIYLPAFMLQNVATIIKPEESQHHIKGLILLLSIYVCVNNYKFYWLLRTNNKKHFPFKW